MNNLHTKLGVGISMLPVLLAPLAADAAIGSGLVNAGSSISTSASSASLGSATDLPTLVGRGISVVLGVLGIVFVVLVVYAGFLYLTSNGEEKNVGKAKKMLTQAVIGLVIIVSAYAISGFVISALTTVTGSR